MTFLLYVGMQPSRSRWLDWDRSAGHVFAKYGQVLLAVTKSAFRSWRTIPPHGAYLSVPVTTVRLSVASGLLSARYLRRAFGLRHVHSPYFPQLVW